MKIRYLFTAFRLFNSILEVKPMMTGCYNWIRVFNGDAKNYCELSDEDLEKYDVIMVNLDGQDSRLVPDLRNRLGNSSSTKIVVNQDYSPEVMPSGFDQYVDLKNAIMLADRVFVTTPACQKEFEFIAEGKKTIYLIPHPCETHVLKKFNSFIENDWIVNYFHRYYVDCFTPYLILKDLKKEFGLVGYIESSDKFSRRTKSVFKRIVNYLPFPDILKLMKEARLHLFIPFSYTWGRIPLDVACMNRPLVASKHIWSAQILYPLTLVDPFDVQKARELLIKLDQDDAFYSEVCNIAYYNVEFFGHKLSRERFLSMLEN